MGLPVHSGLSNGLQGQWCLQLSWPRHMHNRQHTSHLCYLLIWEAMINTWVSFIGLGNEVITKKQSLQRSSVGAQTEFDLPSTSTTGVIEIRDEINMHWDHRSTEASPGSHQGLRCRPEMLNLEESENSGENTIQGNGPLTPRKWSKCAILSFSYMPRGLQRPAQDQIPRPLVSEQKWGSSWVYEIHIYLTCSDSFF